MRTFASFVLALVGTAVLTSDASAFGKRRGGSGCNGGGYTYSGYGYSGYGCGGYTHGGYGHHGAVSYGCSGYSYGGSGFHSAFGSAYSGSAIGYSSAPWTTTAGEATVVQGTDGQYYTRGADGSYYAGSTGWHGAGGITTLGGFTTSPYSSGIYPAGYYPSRGTSSYYPSGVFHSGGVYYGPVGQGGSIVPASGTTPLTMPGITVGPGGITVVPGVMPRR